MSTIPRTQQDSYDFQEEEQVSFRAGTPPSMFGTLELSHEIFQHQPNPDQQIHQILLEPSQDNDPVGRRALHGPHEAELAVFGQK